VSEITHDIQFSDVEWPHTQTYERGVKLAEPREVTIFEEEKALALLLANEVVFLNCFWWEKEWPEKARKATSISVNCNDIFAWGCADAEDLPYADIEPLYRMWRLDPEWGPSKWCAFRRKQKPQPPVIAAMKKSGSWDDAMENLGPNTQDAEVQAIFASLSKSSPSSPPVTPEGE
jgi:hypothetical protein